MIYLEEVSNVEKHILRAMEKEGEISPLLFLSSNLEILHTTLLANIYDILKQKGIDTHSVFHLQDTGEAIKIEAFKTFISPSSQKARFGFQIFLIENISRMTRQAANAGLKFFEEPGEGNIIILTNESESGVLDTILSRVHSIQLSTTHSFIENNFYVSMIESHINQTSDELVRYFFSSKLEKQEYLEFLQSLLHYLVKKGIHTDMLEELHEDIGGILKNNLQGKYVTDKYIMLLGN